MESGLLGKCGVFWLHMAAEVEDFNLHLVTTTYGDTALYIGIAE